MRRKPAPKGAPLAFFNAALQLDTDECIIWPFGLSSGYGTLAVAKGVRIRVTRLACIQVYGPPPNPKDVVLHGPCHDQRCFNPRHLRWGTQAENMMDRNRDGTMPKGESHWTVRRKRGEQ